MSVFRKETIYHLCQKSPFTCFIISLTNTVMLGPVSLVRTSVCTGSFITFTKEAMFCWCLSDYEQDNLKSFEQICMKFRANVGHSSREKWFDFGSDINTNEGRGVHSVMGQFWSSSSFLYCKDWLMHSSQSYAATHSRTDLPRGVVHALGPSCTSFKTELQTETTRTMSPVTGPLHS